MPRTPVLERPSVVRIVGIAFICLMLLMVWLTYAVFDKKFVDSVPITIVASHTGLDLPDNADVKLRGMTVGEVRNVQLDDGGVRLDVAMDPQHIDDVPQGVKALIVPKTLFGEKYVALQPPKQNNGQTLQAGAQIVNAEVPTQVESLLNDIYPLLETVRPQELAYTLNAVSTALDGRGERIGQNVETLDAYLKKITPLTPKLISDIERLGRVSDQYADVMPEIGNILDNAVVTGDTLVAKRAQLQAFFDEGVKLSDTTRTFVAKNEQNIEGLTKEAVPTAQLLAQYSPIFPCMTKAVAKQVPRYDDLFRNRTLHINLETLPLADLPTGYTGAETPKAPTAQDVKQNPKLLGPNCHTLPDSPYDQKNVAPAPPLKTYQKIGIQGDHNKYRAAPHATASDRLVSLVQPSVPSVVDQRAAADTVLAPVLRTSPGHVSSEALLLGVPAMSGSGVRISAGS